MPTTRHSHCPSACGRTRRSFLADCGLGFTGLALGAMLARDGVARADAPGTWAPGKPHFAPRAKKVIWLFMLGGTSHVEGFDPKPALNTFAGKTIAETPHADVLNNPATKDNVRSLLVQRPLNSVIYPLQVGYRPRGQSGTLVSDWWPHVGECIDELALVRSVWLTDNDHGAQYEYHTGRNFLDGSHPSIGSWIKYGLGSLSDNLPQFVALGSPPGTCCGGIGAHSASYLGPEHNAVPLAVDPANPLAYASPGAGVFREEQRSELDLVQGLNRLSAQQHPHDAALAARIRAYELAFRMQTSVPEVMRFDDEGEDTRKLYGLDSDVTRPFGQLCLAARRLVERDVRFVQVYHGDGQSNAWDAHANIKDNHSKLCPQVDLPIAGLLKDLKQRGLLDETIVVWGSEFGRTPIVDANGGNANGRDHHPYGFTVWLAGGGIKAGVVHGATDELGFHAVEGRHYITDIHSTVLHQLGLDSHRLEIPGRKRLDLECGRPIREIIA